VFSRIFIQRPINASIVGNNITIIFTQSFQASMPRGTKKGRNLLDFICLLLARSEYSVTANEYAVAVNYGWVALRTESYNFSSSGIANRASVQMSALCFYFWHGYIELNQLRSMYTCNMGIPRKSRAAHLILFEIIHRRRFCICLFICSFTDDALRGVVLQNILKIVINKAIH